MQSEPNSDQNSQQQLQTNSTSNIIEVEKSPDTGKGKKRHSLRRRSFLTHAGIFTAAGAVAGAIGSPFSSKRENSAYAKSIGSLSDEQFRENAYQVRVAAAKANRELPVLPHPTNDDEKRYDNKIATNTRGLPHNKLGEVDLNAYDSLIKALSSGNPDDFEKIILGGTRKLVSPLGPLAISLEGLTPPQFTVPPAPTLTSDEQAAEIIELYWQALLRDVPFTEFQDNTNNPLVLAAVDELNKLPGYRGPKPNGRVTPQNLFRGSVNYVNAQADPSGRATAYYTLPGVTIGPLSSQFLLLPAPLGYQFISPLIRPALPGKENEFLIDYNEWLLVQNGGSSGRSIQFDSTQRYVFNGRDQAEVARNGGNLFFEAALVLQTASSEDAGFGGIGAPLNPGNPYVKSRTQVGSAATFAGPYFNGLLLRATTFAIRAAYWQKFYVHRRLRPEEFAGLVYNNIVNKTQYPIAGTVLNSQALAQTFSTYGTYLLPHAYPEGAPFHSSYPGGAAAIAGAHATLLKAFFDENFVIPNPVVPNPNDPTQVIPYDGEPLTVGGELNKLAGNYTLGRSSAGIHWRSDGAAAIALGEAVAIAILKDERLTFRENFDGYTFTKFDGTKITV